MATTAPPGPRTAPTRHACQRWVERVDPSASMHEAGQAIEAMLAEGSRSKRPRRWLMAGRSIHQSAEGITRDGAQGGAVYVYSMAWPGVALLVCGDRVVTVLTREWTRRRRRMLRAEAA